MKTIIAGSRSIEDYDEVCAAVRDSHYDITEVVSGGARGVDKLGEIWAEVHKIPTTGKQFYITADEWRYWEMRGQLWKAGHHRNRRMAEYAEALVLIWDGRSGGSKSMLEEARRLGRLVFTRVVAIGHRERDPTPTE